MDCCAFIVARRLERLPWQGRAGRALRPLVSAELACGVRAVIPRFFHLAEIAAAMLLLFFGESAAMDYWTMQGHFTVRQAHQMSLADVHC